MVGKTITISTINTSLQRLSTGISCAVVIAAGAINLPKLASSSATLISLRSIWNLAISQTVIFSLAMLCAAFPFTSGMEWLNSNKVASARKQAIRRIQSVGQRARFHKNCVRARKEHKVLEYGEYMATLVTGFEITGSFHIKPGLRVSIN